jgi:hypothetical protein
MKKSNTIMAIILCNIRSLPFISISVFPEGTINGYPVRRFLKNQKGDGRVAERVEQACQSLNCRELITNSYGGI